MNRSGISACLLAAVTVIAAGVVQAKKLETMSEVRSELHTCWSPPPDIIKSSVTLSFSFRRDGSLMGPPRATAINVLGDDNAKAPFLNAAIEAVEKCTPLQLAPSLAQEISGGVFTTQFHSSD
ncbi:hypothetical protein [Brucella anthropi]